MIGMNLVDTWKGLKLQDNKTTVYDFADMLVQEMLDYANDIEAQEEQVTNDDITLATNLTDAVSFNANSHLTSVSSLSNPKQICFHTKVFLKRNKQLRCIWCSRVNLVERKTTMMCKECNKGFCRDGSGYSCWSHHIACGGVPTAPSRGTKKRSVGEAQEQDPQT